MLYKVLILFHLSRSLLLRSPSVELDGSGIHALEFFLHEGRIAHLSCHGDALPTLSKCLLNCAGLGSVPARAPYLSRGLTTKTFNDLCVVSSEPA